MKKEKIYKFIEELGGGQGGVKVYWIDIFPEKSDNMLILASSFSYR
jgi:hypothetical protein